MPTASPQTYRLPTLGIRQQLRAGRLTRRWLQLFAGLGMAGFSIGLMVEARLGLDPWNVLHEGLTQLLPLSFGMVTVVSGLVVLLLWVPLHQPLGLGTVVNTVLVGLLVDVALWALPSPESLLTRGVPGRRRGDVRRRGGDLPRQPSRSRAA